MPEKFFVSAKALIVHDGKLLLLRDKEKGVIHNDFPGGRIEKDELLEDGLQREVCEEIGSDTKILSAKIIHAQSCRRFVDDDQIVVIYFKTNVDLGKIVLSEKHFEYVWIDPAEFENMDDGTNVFDIDKVAVSRLIKDKK